MLQSRNDQDTRLLNREQCESIVQKCIGFAGKNRETTVRIESKWSGELRWARNRVTLGSDRRMLSVLVSVYVPGNVIGGTAYTNQIDDVSLQATARAAEENLIVKRALLDMKTVSPVLSSANADIWSDATFNLSADVRAQLSHTISREAEGKGMMAAGYLQMNAGERVIGDVNNFKIDLFTQAQCSMTVRDPKGRGSGWAGLSGYDWNKINGNNIAQIALDKCILSLEPVRIEPGRYTVVLEPQAVSDCVNALMDSFRRSSAEFGQGPFVLGRDPALNLIRSKLGLRVIDERISISHDPGDPLLGVLPWSEMGPIEWIEKGILTTLDFSREYGLSSLTSSGPMAARQSYRMSGGNTPIADMIKSTSRGLLVTRMNSVSTMDNTSLMATGVTRDGLWLIEGGKISKSVNNLRFTDSPLFILNQIEELGVPEPVFRPQHPSLVYLTPTVVPPIKARDFSFTSLVDAI